jgi:hypothetical protein
MFNEKPNFIGLMSLFISKIHEGIIKKIIVNLFTGYLKVSKFGDVIKSFSYDRFNV